MNDKKIRTVQVNDRGQVVIPEDVRNDLGIKGGSTLVMIKKEDEIVLKKESSVLEAIDSDAIFWKAISAASLQRAWGKEDEIWDKIAKKNLKR